MCVLRVCGTCTVTRIRTHTSTLPKLSICFLSTSKTAPSGLVGSYARVEYGITALTGLRTVW